MKASYKLVPSEIYPIKRLLNFDTMLTRSLWLTCLAWISIGSVATAIAGEHSLKLSEFKPDKIFHNHCSVCHGDNGDGRSRASTSLVPPPRNFTTAGDLTREKMIATVTNGKPGTAMTSWKTQLSAKQIEEVVDYVRNTFMQEAIRQRLTFGSLLYGHNCASCHGNKGQGIAASGVAAAPQGLSHPLTSSSFSRERMIATVRDGLPGTAMTGYAQTLPLDRIETVVDYVFELLKAVEIKPASAGDVSNMSANTPQTAETSDMSLPMPKGLIGNVQPGQQFFMGNCSTCHGKSGDGQGPRAYFMATKPRNFHDDFSHSALNRPRIFSSITLGRPGTEMPAWGTVLTEQEIANVAEFVFQTFIRPGAQ